ncbi:MAG: nitroreductase family protein [Armatimonadota bacterium]
MFEDIVKANRSYRRFYQDKAIDRETLLHLVNLARLTPSASNLQPMKYVLSCEPEMNAEIFKSLGWAGYLTDWPGPDEGERPGAYIIIVGDTEISKNFGCDHGIVAQTILLGAVEKGLGGCMMGAINRTQLRETLNLPERYEILLVVALGYPKEQVVIEDIGLDGSVKYHRDAQGVHHVPKRTLDEIVIG